jgi:hypothetical protein
MLTEKQKAASRANGAKSRGPVTPRGRMISSRNSLHHGILARAVVLDTENKDRFHELLRSLHATYRPVGPAESLLVQKMAVSQWRLMRLWSHQKAAFALELREQPASLAAEDVPTRDSVAFATLGPPRTPSVSTMDRCETTYDRQFARSLRLLRWEQEMRKRTPEVVENTEDFAEFETQNTLENG